MPAHAGIFYRDRRPVPLEVIEGLSETNRDCGPDATGSYLFDGVALLSFGLHFDALSLRERQPVHTPDGCVTVWDGRLDNRDDVAVTLGSDLPADRSDAALVSAALAKWPDRALSMLVGDWTLARWNPARRELLLARDYCGGRDLHYYIGPDTVAWSTCLASLVNVCERHGQISDDFMARFLTYRATERFTPYDGLVHLPPGESLLIRADHSTERRFFGELRYRSVRYKDARDYETHYRESLTEAVKVRLRARRTVWTELSGGHDSSSITCIASRLVRTGAVETPSLQAVSRVFPRSPESDESPHIRAVEQFCGIQTVAIEPEEMAGSSIDDLLDTPAIPKGSTDARVVDAGDHVLLTGEMGDVVSAGGTQDEAYLDHLASGHFGALWADILAPCRFNRSPIWSALWALRRTFFPKPPYRAPSTDLVKQYALTPSFAARAAAVPAPPHDDFHQWPRTRRIYLRRVTDFINGNIFDSRTRPSPLIVTHPFTHRPLVELVLGMPASVLWRPVHARAFTCSALRDVLPSAITTRESKGYSAPEHARSLSTLATAALADLDSWDLVSGRYVDRDAFEMQLRGMLDGSDRTAGALTRLFGAEVTIRTTQRPRGRHRLADLTTY